MDDIQELERNLAIAKAAKLRNSWISYLNKSKGFLECLVGRTFIRWYRNGRFVIFKVIGFEEKYYGDIEGMKGQNGPGRWFEITTTGHLDVSVQDDRGKYFDPGIDNINYANFEFIQAPKKGFNKGKILISKIDFKDKTCAGDVQSVFIFGKGEYSENKQNPNYEAALMNFTMFLHEVPVQIYDEAKAIHDDNVQKTINFWEKNKSTIENSPRINL